PGSEIRALWAAQRIKNFSLGKVMLRVLGLSREEVTTLIEEFRYPRLGPGQMWETFAARVEEMAIGVPLHHRCVGLEHADGRVRRVVLHHDGGVRDYPVD